MNMMLLRPEEAGSRIARSDPRVRHVLKVLKKGIGDEVVAGMEGGRPGTARLESLDDEGAVFSFRAEGESEPLRPLALILGFPRPIQANRIVKDLVSLGVSRIVLCGTDLGEASYLQSGFYGDEGWRGAVREGASQAGNPLLPEVGTAGSLERAVASIEGLPGLRVALDNEGEGSPFARLGFDRGAGAVLAVGSERGWSARERSLLAAEGFARARLGGRILRTETASLAAVVLCLAAMGYM